MATNKITKTDPLKCSIASQQVDGANYTLGLLGLGTIGVIYWTTENNYAGAGLQALVYGSAIVGGAFMIATALTNSYKTVQCFR
jgi:hypothetical protein